MATMNEANIDMKRYDRQIRLWGKDTQVGILGARILFLRVTGLCTEVAKNLVLAGVGHVTVCDPEKVTQDDIDTGAVFYFGKGDVGRPRAEVLAEHLRQLNPSVNIAARVVDARNFDADELGTFNYIIGTHGAGAVSDLIACAETLEPTVVEEPPRKKARANGAEAETAPAPRGAVNGGNVVLPMRPPEKPMPKMMAAGTLGLHGFCVLDLREHVHVPLEPKKKKDDEAEKAASSKAAEPARMRVVYPSIKQAMGVDWAAFGKRVPPFFAALQLLCELHKHKRSPAGTATADTAKWLEHRRFAKLQEAERPAEWLSADFVARVARHAQAEMAPVCAVVGGVVASEVIKIISGKGAPINNAFFFDALDTSEGIVQRLGPSFSCPWGVDAGKPVALEE